MAPENNSLDERLMIQVLDRLSSIDTTLGNVGGQLESLRGWMERVAPLVDKHEEAHNQTLGGWRVGSGIWKMVISGGFGAGFIEAVQHLVGPGKHP